MKSLPTKYNGVVFRSRTEARWALFFDLMQIRWDYEPEGYRLSDGLCYQPDFWLPDWEIWVEVKSSTGPDPKERSWDKAYYLVQASKRPLLFLLGVPRPQLYTLLTVETLDGDLEPFPWSACFSAKGIKQNRMWIEVDREESAAQWHAQFGGIAHAMAIARNKRFHDPDTGDYAALGWEGTGAA